MRKERFKRWTWIECERSWHRMLSMPRETGRNAFHSKARARSVSGIARAFAYRGGVNHNPFNPLWSKGRVFLRNSNFANFKRRSFTVR